MQTVCNNKVSVLGGFQLYSQAKDKLDGVYNETFNFHAMQNILAFAM